VTNVVIESRRQPRDYYTAVGEVRKKQNWLVLLIGTAVLPPNHSRNCTNNKQLHETAHSWHCTKQKKWKTKTEKYCCLSIILFDGSHGQMTGTNCCMPCRKAWYLQTKLLTLMSFVLQILQGWPLFQFE
jgi:hypothetical protein